jgi:hypothetical protein
MPSIGTFRAQPVTRTFAVTQGDWGAYYFTQDMIDSWYDDNKDDMTKTGSVFIVNSTDKTVFQNIMDSLGPSGGNTPRFDERKTLTDFGGEVVIGNLINSRMVVLRRVQGYGNIEGGGLASTVGYIVAENNCDDLAGNSGRFTVRVARM